MALLSPRIMSTTSTYLQLEELNEKKSTTFHREIYTESFPTLSNAARSKDNACTRQLPETRQSVLLLKGVREEYTLVNDHAIPSVLHPGEILVKVP